MKYLIVIIFFVLEVVAMDTAKWQKELDKLSDFDRNIIVNKGTERAFSGRYLDTLISGTFNCKVCNTPLFRSKDKFDSKSGWISFDDIIASNVKELPDQDGRRTEIVCANCGAHLGHVFHGEGFTDKETRHCVNSASVNLTKKAYFAGGCFWGVEHLFAKQNGVISATSGYMGGKLPNPSYEDVVYKNTGHLEVVEILYDPTLISYENLAKFFFEIHDPEQTDGQGPDIGEQYLSAIFTSDQEERKIVEKLIGELESKGYQIATTIRELAQFYKAEEYHQNYYEKTGKKPYCHTHIKRF